MPTSNPEFSVHDFTAENGIPFRARVLLPGDDYGAFNQNGWAMKKEADSKPMVEFYDRRYDHSPHGQFVSRYSLETLSDYFATRKPTRHASGLNLHGGEEDWQLGHADVASTVSWAKAHVEHRQAHPMNAMELGYIEAALFVTSDENDKPLNLAFTTDSVGPQIRKEAKEACDAFRQENQVLVAQALSQPDYSESKLGEDLWMTRNGHGTGFWDQEELNVAVPDSERHKGDTLAEALSEMARELKEVNLIVNDEGGLDFSLSTHVSPRP